MTRADPIRYSVLACALLAILTACTGSGSAGVTTTTRPVLEGPSTTVAISNDVELITELWRRQTSAWTAGFDAGIEFWVDNNYPAMGCTFSDFMSSRFPLGPVEGLIIERIVDPASIESDDGWIIPGGSLEGQVAEGNVYKLAVEHRRLETGRPTPEPETLELHVTILDGQPYFFLGCP